MSDPLASDASGDARVKLFCFPHAGGAAHSFSRWVPLLARAGVEAIALTYPGRGMRWHASPGQAQASVTSARYATSMDDLVDDLMQTIVSELDRPFAFFGHSLGGLVAHAVCIRLSQGNLPLPIRLFVSSVQAPMFQGSSRGEDDRMYTPLSQLDDATFVTEAFERGWFPKEAMENAELRALVLPTLRADIAIYDSYRAACATATVVPLQDPNIIIEAFGGSADVSVPPDTLSSWNPVKTHIIEGAGHFHTETNLDELLALILASCRGVLASRSPSVSMGRYIRFPAEDLCCHDIFERQARASPQAICVVDERRGSLTFAQVLSESHLLARRLQEGGVGPGLRGVVGVLSSPSADFLIAMFAIFRAGGAVLPFYVNYTKELIEDLVGSANVAFMLVDGDPDRGLTDRVPTVLSDAGKSFALVKGWADTLAKRDSTATLSSDDAATSVRLNSSFDADAPTASPLPPLCLFEGINPESIALMAMTSGSSGKPKAIVVSHRATIVSFAARWEMLPYDENDVIASNIFFVWEALRGPMKGVSWTFFFGFACHHS